MYFTITLLCKNMKQITETYFYLDDECKYFIFLSLFFCV